jgi:heat shock protein HslJ
MPAHRLARRLALACTALLAPLAVAAASEPRPAAAPRLGAHGLMLPGSFSGDLPAASGPGIRHRLDLWPDQVFQLRRIWIDRGTTEDLLGRWHVDPDRRALVLEGGETPPTQFEIMGNGNLRLLDREGRRIESTLPYTLTRQDEFAPFEPRLTMRGMFLYFADAARFTECRSGRSWPVAMEGDFLSLQRAYLAARPEPQAGAMPSSLLARIEGTVAQRPRMEGEGTIPTVVVERFVSLAPGDSCDRPAGQATLRNTYWRIATLAGEAIGVEEGRREPYLLLRLDEPRFAATVGCNQMLGGFETTGSALRFRPGPMTMMACPEPLAARERTLAAALAETASYRLEGLSLTLLAADARPLATFEAVYLR